MTKKLLHFLISTFSSLLILISLGTAQTGMHKLEIISEKPFELFINDVLIGVKLNFDTLVSANSYKIEAYLIDEGTIKTIFKQNVDITSDLTIRFDTSYYMTVKTYPDDAQVYFDSIYFGSTPLKLSLLYRPTLLEIRKTGFKEFRKDISNLNCYDFYIKLDRENFQKTKFTLYYKYIALASTVINGALAAYSKQMANRYFYKNNRTENDMKKVKTYDRYSGIFTIGMEISFGIFVYMLFQE